MIRPLPPEFISTMSNLYGQRGTDWCTTIGMHLAKLAVQWDLSLGDAFPLSYNYVCTATITKTQRAVVLKTAPANPDFDTEVAMLQHYGGRSAVEIIAVDDHATALLIARADPGIRLVDSGLHDDEQTGIAAQLMRASWYPKSSVLNLPTIVSQVGILSTLSTDHPAAVALLGSSHLLTAVRLCAQLQRPDVGVPLHGDLHHENILQHGSQWLIIDPKGIIGNPAAECAAFLRNPGRLLDSGIDVVALTIRRIDIFHQILGVPAAEIAGWNYVLMVLSAWWCYEEEHTIHRRVLGYIDAFAHVAAHYGVIAA